MSPKVKEAMLWVLLGVSGVGASAANIGGAAMAERVAKTEARVEAESVLNAGRLDRIEKKLDELLLRR